MYVKVVHDYEFQPGLEAIYECEAIVFPPSDEHIVLIKGSEPDQVIDVPEEKNLTLAVYVMNDQGKTIDQRRIESLVSEEPDF